MQLLFDYRFKTLGQIKAAEENAKWRYASYVRRTKQEF